MGRCIGHDEHVVDRGIGALRPELLATAENPTECIDRRRDQIA